MKFSGLISSVVLLLAMNLVAFSQTPTVNPFGVVVQKAFNADGTGPINPSATGVIAEAKALNVPFVRTSTSVYNGPSGLIETPLRYSAAGLRVILNLNNTPPALPNGDRPPSVPPSDYNAYKATIAAAITKYQPELLVIENEENNAQFYSGTATDYTNQLQAAIDVAHANGAKVTNGGITETEASMLVWSDYYSRGQQAQADAWAQRSLEARVANDLPTVANPNRPILGNNPALAAQQGFVTAMFAAYKTLALDYVNLHWYQYDPAHPPIRGADVLQDIVNFLRQSTGKDVITNEIGERFVPAPEAVTSLLQKCLDLGMRYVIWFDGDGDPAVALHNGDGSLRPNGVAFRDFVLARFPVRQSTSVNAASYTSAQAPEVIASLFGPTLALTTQVAVSQPLPITLAGTTVSVRDSAGMDRLAPLFFVSPTQINYQIPAGTASGAATIMVVNNNGGIAQGTLQVTNVAPGLFSVDASGRGLAAANVLRVKADGSQSYEPVGRFDATQSKFVAVPIDLGPATDQVFLLLYGTGIRYRNSLANVSAKLGGTDAQVLFAGAQGGYVGLDQINVQIPRSLIGRGLVDVALTVNGMNANTVQVSVK